MPAPTVVILAAGQGTRMRSALPKVLHPLCGRPLVLWPVAAAWAAGAGTVVVVGGPDRALDGHLPEGVTLAVQAEPNGTADAVESAGEHLGTAGTVVVLSGDVPLVTAATLRELVEAHEAAGAAATMMTTELDDPSGYGRVVRAADGSVQRVVETKAPGDATPEELAIREINAGIYAFDAALLAGALARVRADNSQGERYLPDVLPLLRADGRLVGAHRVDDPAVALGVNDRADLAVVRAYAQARIARHHQLAGVTIVDPASTVIDAGVEIGEDTVVEPSSFLHGRTRIGAGATIGPLTTLHDTEVGDGATVVRSHAVEAVIEAGATVGPFTDLRPGTRLREGAKAGAFVEIKNSDIGAGAKVPHLSYIGDADVGERANLGAATITANYDGRRKHRT
ncbi:MAG TPA: bifunctional UDP-N-acetylglucosamine diphosphorylase/glucosamine-1-phosphate N-acetyltransferase GlmU, partial [Solirubrobacteraceae bacterium]|nr:bifunctional UDP-N-acetylglucosamine diphosphorylase/glucosamine-1-phosphate N-acetyltransferase GlmU [Solirubrobacteraceae bacterium]